MKRHFRQLIITLLCVIASLATPQQAAAQEDYRFDIGGGVGMSGYLGDANPSALWSHPGFDAELLFRYIANPRWAFKTNFYVTTISGDTQKMQDILPGGEHYSFSTTVYELGEMAEFNFFSYGIGESYRKLKRFSPYITAGLGLNLWNADGSTGFALGIPFGIGLKYKVSKRLNLGLEFLMKKTFTDWLDSKPLSDPYNIKSSFMKNTDWISTLTFTISYEFSKRCEVCNYKE